MNLQQKISFKNMKVKISITKEPHFLELNRLRSRYGQFFQRVQNEIWDLWKEFKFWFDRFFCHFYNNTKKILWEKFVKCQIFQFYTVGKLQNFISIFWAICQFLDLENASKFVNSPNLNNEKLCMWWKVLFSLC